MHSTLRLLGIILIAQIALVVGLNLRPSKLESYSSDQPVLSLDKSKVNKLVISDSAKTLTLVKSEAHWIVQDDNAFPADSRKIDSLLTDIAGFKRSWPVAQTEASFKPLKVAESSFERRLQFMDQDTKLAELLLGTSPSFKKAHGRVAGDNLVYTLDLNTVDLPVNSADWYDREYLYLQSDKIESLALPKVTLQQTAGKFAPNDLTEQEEVNTVEMEALTGQLLQLRFTEMLGKAKPAEFDKLKKDELAFTVSLKEPQREIVYNLRGPYQDNFFILKRNTEDFYFKVPKGLAEKVKELDRGKLVQPKEPITAAN